MDAEGSHSGDRNGCGDGKQWRRGKGIVGERKRCRGEGGSERKGMVGERKQCRGDGGERKRCRGKGWWASGASSASERHDYG